jgi:hypothetical protein
MYTAPGTIEALIETMICLSDLRRPKSRSTLPPPPRRRQRRRRRRRCDFKLHIPNSGHCDKPPGRSAAPALPGYSPHNSRE